MRILLVTESLGSGGAERQLVGLAEMLKARGYDVSVLTYYYRNFYKSLLDEAGITNECDIKSFNRYTRFVKLSKKANSYHADIVVSFLPGSNIALTIGKVLGILKSKLIVSERNFTLNWTFKSKLFYKILSFADCLLVNSVAEKDNVKEHIRCYSNKEIEVIRNFIDSNYFTSDFGYNRNSNNIVCVARLRNYKNVTGFIDCAAILKKRGYSFVVNWYGHDYNDGYSNEVKKKIREFQLEDYFVLHAPSDNIRDVYRHSDALCLPSFREGYPNVVVEAMSCKLPVLCSNVCENPNIVEDKINGFLFDPYDVNSMVNAVEKFFSLSKEDRIQIGENNRRKVVVNNSKEVFVNRYIELFEKILK